MLVLLLFVSMIYSSALWVVGEEEQDPYIYSEEEIDNRLPTVHRALNHLSSPFFNMNRIVSEVQGL